MKTLLAALSESQLDDSSHSTETCSSSATPSKCENETNNFLKSHHGTNENEDYSGFFEQGCDSEEEIPSPIPIKTPVRKKRRRILTVSPNSYYPSIESKKPFHGETSKNALKERYTQFGIFFLLYILM